MLATFDTMKLVSLRSEPEFQIEGGPCVPCAFASVFEMHWGDLARELHTNPATGGTNFARATAWLKENSAARTVLVEVNEDWEDAWWLEALSSKFSLILSANWKHKPERKGRARDLHHAISVVDGIVFDSAAIEPLPIECFKGRFDNALIIKSMIIVERE